MYTYVYASMVAICIYYAFPSFDLRAIICAIYEDPLNRHISSLNTEFQNDRDLFGYVDIDDW